MRRRLHHPTGRATDREVGVVAAVLGLSHSTIDHDPAKAHSKVGVTTTAQLVLGPYWLRRRSSVPIR